MFHDVPFHHDRGPGEASEVAARKIRLVEILIQAGIQPTPITGLALLDTAVTVLVVNDMAAEAIQQRVTTRLADAETLRLALAESAGPSH
jgi:hypothetical protein